MSCCTNMVQQFFFTLGLFVLHVCNQPLNLRDAFL